MDWEKIQEKQQMLIEELFKDATLKEVEKLNKILEYERELTLLEG